MVLRVFSGNPGASKGVSTVSRGGGVIWRVFWVCGKSARGSLWGGWVLFSVGTVVKCGSCWGIVVVSWVSSGCVGVFPVGVVVFGVFLGGSWVVWG